MDPLKWIDHQELKMKKKNSRKKKKKKSCVRVECNERKLENNVVIAADTHLNIFLHW